MNEKNNQTTKPVKKPKGPKNNKKTLINLIILSVMFGVVFVSALIKSPDVSEFLKKDSKPNFADLVTQIRNDNVSKITVSEDKTKLVVEQFKDGSKDRGNVEKVTYPSIAVGETSVLESINNALGQNGNGEDVKVKIGSSEGEIIYEETPKSFLNKMFDSMIFQIILYVGIIIIGLSYLLKKLTDANSKSISFAQSRARNFEELDKKDRVTFEDVAGNEEAKLELTEVVDFLKRPQEYLKMGARIPRGVLLVGSPGNGKTLIAKAVAGEANVPFLFVSGSEFVEMFVGVGAGRVRDLFKQAKKKSPCVIFIDEIDAVGRQRGGGLGNSNDEREQTLNQILVEMDGFESNESVIVIGATNRPDILDKALLRPGRFDRQVTVTMPDKKEREQILKVHAKNKKLTKDADLSIVARRTSGFSGADLMNVLNEAAILTVREGKKAIDNDVLREAIEKSLLGPSLKSKVITDEQKKLTAYHEAGHALIASVLPDADKVQKITIIPRGKAGGYTFTDHGENDPTTIKKSKFLAEIATLYGGYVTEKMIFGEVSTGPSNDIERATTIARQMVTKYGMSELGPVAFGDDKTFHVGFELEEKIPYSQQTTKSIDEEVQEILKNCYNTAAKIIKEYRTKLDQIANKLLEEETIEFEAWEELVKDLLPDQKTA